MNKHPLAPGTLFVYGTKHKIGMILKHLPEARPNSKLLWYTVFLQGVKFDTFWDRALKILEQESSP